MASFLTGLLTFTQWSKVRNRMKLLGIDVGTGGTRAVAVDESGNVVAAATAEHAPFASPHIGWAEQDPRDWWRATIEAVHKVLAGPKVRVSDIACIGFSAQTHGAVLLAQSGELFRAPPT